MLRGQDAQGSGYSGVRMLRDWDQDVQGSGCSHWQVPGWDVGGVAQVGTPQGSPLIHLQLSLSQMMDFAGKTKGVKAVVTAAARPALHISPLSPQPQSDKRRPKSNKSPFFQTFLHFPTGKVPGGSSWLSLSASPGAAHLTDIPAKAGLRPQAQQPNCSSPQTPGALLLPHGQLLTQIPRLFTPAGRNLANPSAVSDLPLPELGELPGAARTGRGPAAAPQTRAKPRAELNPDPQSWRVPPTPTRDYPPKTAGSRQEFNSFSGEKL